MDPLIAGVAAFLIIGLGQIPAVFLLGRYCEMDEETYEAPPTQRLWRERFEAEDAARETSPPKRQTDRATIDARALIGRNSDVVRCLRCDAENEPEYTYCQLCLAQIP